VANFNGSELCSQILPDYSVVVEEVIGLLDHFNWRARQPALSAPPAHHEMLQIMEELQNKPFLRLPFCQFSDHQLTNLSVAVLLLIFCELLANIFLSFVASTQLRYLPLEIMVVYRFDEHALLSAWIGAFDDSAELLYTVYLL
jgi:hypothetical protein